MESLLLAKTKTAELSKSEENLCLFEFSFVSVRRSGLLSFLRLSSPLLFTLRPWKELGFASKIR
jgi:hypothetical protein